MYAVGQFLYSKVDGMYRSSGYSVDQNGQEVWETDQRELRGSDIRYPKLSGVMVVLDVARVFRKGRKDQIFMRLVGRFGDREKYSGIFDYNERAIELKLGYRLPLGKASRFVEEAN